jgi:signal peptidase I
MAMNIGLILVIATVVMGVILLLDKLVFARKRTGKLPLVVDISRSVFPVVLIVLLIRSFIGEPFRIPSGSMMPTLLVGDFILVSKFSYGLRLPVTNTRILDTGSPERGDVAVFRYPVDDKTDFIKRIVAVPGDTVAYRNKTLYINGEPQPVELIGRYQGTGSGQNQTGNLHASENLTGVRHEILREATLQWETTGTTATTAVAGGSCRMKIWWARRHTSGCISIRKWTGCRLTGGE